MPADQNRLIAETRESHLWLTINRPEKANALTVDLMESITDAILGASRDANVRAVLLTGAGERVFCAGVDVREQPDDGNMTRQRERRSAALAALQDAVLDVPKPMVAVLNGIASGGGAMLALLADACIAVDAAQLSIPEIDLGIATFSGANILEVIGGRALALDLVQSGRRMPAQEAVTRGLIGTTVTRDRLQTQASAVAERLASKNAHAFADNKRWINRGLKAALADAREEHARHRAKPSA
jgi:enoyl-CoA hydratase/carnithine racemase